MSEVLHQMLARACVPKGGCCRAIIEQNFVSRWSSWQTLSTSGGKKSAEAYGAKTLQHLPTHSVLKGPHFGATPWGNEGGIAA